MRRRAIHASILIAALGWPVPLSAQQNLPVIGFLAVTPPAPALAQSAEAALRQGLGRADIAEGRDVALDIRWTQTQYDLLKAGAADLVGRAPRVIVAVGAPAAVAARTASRAVPLVFSVSEDPASLGLVPRFNNATGTATGVAYFGSTAVPRQMELLSEILDKDAAIAVLINSRSGDAKTKRKAAELAARILNRKLHIVTASKESELEAAFAKAARLGARGLVIAPAGLLNADAARLAALAAQHRLAAIHASPRFAAAGGLMSYFGSADEAIREAGFYAGRILKGEHPGALPVQQPRSFELVVNRKTAREFGLTLPASLVARAKETID